jgi:hypothetical protein
MNAGKCVIVNGVCENGCSYSADCSYYYCKGSIGSCSYDECAAYKVDECKDLSGSCVFSEGVCHEGSCEDLSNDDDDDDDECTQNSRCELVYDLEESTKKCWSNVCGNKNNCESQKNCVNLGECVFDACRSLNNDYHLFRIYFQLQYIN